MAPPVAGEAFFISFVRCSAGDQATGSTITIIVMLEDVKRFSLSLPFFVMGVKWCRLAKEGDDADTSAMPSRQRFG
jgi:hypothetical protein